MSEYADEGVEREAPTQDAIARRAYEISQSEGAGSEDENWQRAEQELRAEAETARQ